MSLVLSNESAPVIRAEPNREDVTNEQRINGGIPRWADAGIAMVGVVAISPIMALSALAIVITSGRPVFFRQKRVGRGGQTFTLVKFRTMTSANEGPEVTRKGDRRITRLGKFLRQTKLDELPTLWNIVRGDMALVGPRPEVPRYVKLDDPKWLTILKVRPGITDPVTVQLRNEEDLLSGIDGDLESYYVNELQPAKLRGYLDYLQCRSARSDLRLLWRTLFEVLRNRP
jgi:lipopolysaccharide/colanic/teichoic acid biosynthesis glycosyltransferase